MLIGKLWHWKLCSHCDFPTVNAPGWNSVTFQVDIMMTPSYLLTLSHLLRHLLLPQWTRLCLLHLNGKGNWNEAIIIVTITFGEIHYRIIARDSHSTLKTTLSPNACRDSLQLSTTLNMIAALSNAVLIQKWQCWYDPTVDFFFFFRRKF